MENDFVKDKKSMEKLKQQIKELNSNADVSQWIVDEILADKIPLTVAEYVFARNISARSGDKRINENIKCWAAKKLSQLNMDNVQGVIIPSLNSSNFNLIAKRFVDFSIGNAENL